MNRNNNFHNLIVLIFLPLFMFIGIFVCILEELK